MAPCTAPLGWTRTLLIPAWLLCVVGSACLEVADATVDGLQARETARFGPWRDQLAALNTRLEGRQVEISGFPAAPLEPMQLARAQLDAQVVALTAASTNLARIINTRQTLLEQLPHTMARKEFLVLDAAGETMQDVMIQELSNLTQGLNALDAAVYQYREAQAAYAVGQQPTPNPEEH